MKINITKNDVKAILISHPDEWLTTKETASLLKVKNKKAVDRISNILYRLRSDPDIERKRNNATYSYRFIKPTKDISEDNEATIPADYIEKETEDEGDGEDFDGYTDVELLDKPDDGFCEECEEYTRVRFKGEKDGHIVFFCENHGKAIDRWLYGNAGTL